ncbi:ATP-binding protein [Streptomyces sp. NPDC058377]|uniref:ATP-binding protein n=1 Tax=Streptomyces sp. NPDC058377 TaxID=3346468 RepID=UPI0036472AF3
MNGEREVLEDGRRPARGPDEAVGSQAPEKPVRRGRTPGVPRNAAAARDAVVRLLRERFRGRRGEEPAEVVVGDALLVTSELVTNAVRHGGGLTGFTTEITDEGLLLTVSDASTRPPVTAERDPAVVPVGGYGWLLVRRLAKRVSVTYLPDGKHIAALIPLA